MRWRLTDAQWCALDALHDGPCRRSSMSGSGLVNAAAVWSLYRFGFAECHERNVSGGVYHITEAGRARWAEIVTERAELARAAFTEIPV